MCRKYLYTLSLAGGIMAGLPWNGVPGVLLFVVFIPLFIIVEKYSRGLKEGAFSLFPYGFIFFAAWNATAVWWLPVIDLIGGLTVILLNVTLMSLVFTLFVFTRQTAGERSGYASFVIFWLAYEYILLWGDLSWPWLHLGNGFAGNIKLVQWYEHTGVAGGSLWVLLVNVMLFSLWRRSTAGGYLRGCIVQACLLLSVIVIPVIVSYNIFSRYNGNSDDNINVFLLQPNLDPYTEKFDELSLRGRVKDLTGLAEDMPGPPPDYVIAPETAVDSVWLQEENIHLNPLKNYLGENPQTSFILGATLFEEVSCQKEDHTVRFDPDRGICFRVYNSSLHLDFEHGMGVYNKKQLVPGVENIPFHRYITLPGFLSVDLGGVTGIYARGEEPAAFQHHEKEVSAGQLICFESLYGRLAGGTVMEGAGFIAVITNDGWFKGTNAYLQHLRQSQLRAIETRRPIARSANTGVSAIINSRGEITAHGRWMERTVVEGYVTPRGELTFYVLNGDYLGRTAFFFSILIILSVALKQYLLKQKRPSSFR